MSRPGGNGHLAPLPAERDVAIIGMACLFPGAPDVATYWQNIVDKVDSVGDPPPEWESELVYDPDSADNDRIYCKRGGYLGDLSRFNPLDHGVMPQAVQGGEPDHFLTLRAAHEALADAGFPDRALDRGSIEVIVGKGTYINAGYTNLLQHGLVIDQTLQILRELHPEHSEAELQAIKRRLKASLPPLTADVVPALVPNIVAGRIANRLDLMGASYTVDAACASSLIAVEHGVADLIAGKCDLAVVGGVHASTPPPILMIFCQLQALSRRQQIRPFDAAADGTLLGEGLGMIVLKRRADAERDGDRIYALIKGIGTASDGRAMGLLAPRLEGEELALRRAYESTGICTSSVELIEAHGTGTLVGDLTEMQALSRVFGPRDGEMPTCGIGTVKSMISHLIPAAGIAGIIKAALALSHKVLPPTLHCEQPNPAFELERTPFYVNTETRPWVHAGPEPRRAGVNAFGFGGINAHAILEEHPAENTSSLMRRWDSEVLIIQAESRQALIEAANGVLAALADADRVALKDLAYTLNCPLSEGSYRLAIVADSVADYVKKLANALRRLADPDCTTLRLRSGVFFFEKPLGREGKLAFLFPGEGSQYQGMLADLCLHFPEARACFDRGDRVFRENGRRPLPSQMLFPPPSNGDSARPGERTLWDMDLAVASVFAANQALAAVLSRLGIQPDAVVGHSSGDLAALIVSGAVADSSDHALFRHSLELNRMHQSLAASTPSAALVAVGNVDPKAVADAVAASDGTVAIAMDNCPNQVVLCGPEGEMDAAIARLERQGAVCGRLPFDRAYHTPALQPVCDQLGPLFARLPFAAPRIPLYSCATARPYPDEPDEIRRLAVDQWARPVRFHETIEALYATGVRVFVEVGPRRNLTGFVEDILRERPAVTIPCDDPRHSGITQLNHLVGLLAAQHVPLQLDALYARRAPRRLALDRMAHPSSESATSSGVVRVATELPRLRLVGHETNGVSASASGRAAAPAAPAARKPPEPPAPAARPDANADSAGTILPAPRSPSAPSPVVVTPLPPGQPSPMVVTPLPGQPSPLRQRPAVARATAMQEYLQTMERFLETQRSVHAALLGARRPGSAPPRPDASEQRSNGSHPLAERVEPSESPRIEVVSLAPGQEVTARCRLDLDHDLFLLDHTLGRDPSEQDPALTGLPVVPLTMSVEILARTAALLVPGDVLTALRNVRAHRWIEVSEHGISLWARATRVASSDAADVQVSLFEADPSVPNGEPAAPLVEGVAHFGDAYPAPSAPLALRGPDLPYRWQPDRYPEIMFHGPLFRTVESIERLAIDGAVACMRTPTIPRAFRGVAEPSFLTDPVLLDGAGQVVGFWADERFERGFSVFPTGFDALTLYRPLVGGHQPVTCIARIQVLDDGRLRSDIDLVDADGRLAARFEGWEDVRFFDWGREFVRFALAPRGSILSAPWPALTACLPDGRRVACYRVSGLSGIWPRMVGALILSRAERTTWTELAGPEKRRREWLLGRLAAKDALRSYLKDRHGLQVRAADLEIVTSARGQPRATGAALDRLDRGVALSVTHVDGMAAAVVAEGDDVGVGIDVERLGRVTPEVEMVAFDDEERRLLDAVSAPQRQEWLLRFWCAKEATAKALGVGMAGDPRNLAIRAADHATGQVSVQIRGELARLAPIPADRAHPVGTGRDGDLVFALALLEDVTGKEA